MLSKAMNERASGAVAVEADQASALEVWLRYKPPASRIGLRQNPDGLTMTIPHEALGRGNIYRLLFCMEGPNAMSRSAHFEMQWRYMMPPFKILVRLRICMRD